MSSSSATRSATVRAAIRRGWVWPIMPRTPRPSSRQIFGIWVVLPEPVSPATITTWWSRMAAAISSFFWLTGQLLGVADGGHPAARRARIRSSAWATSASISASTAARASGLRILRAPSSLRPSRCASRRDSSVRRGARAPRSGVPGGSAGAGCVDIRGPGSHPREIRGEHFCLRRYGRPFGSPFDWPRRGRGRECRGAGRRETARAPSGGRGLLAVAGAGVEPATYRFSGDRSYQLSYPATRLPGKPQRS